MENSKQYYSFLSGVGCCVVFFFLFLLLLTVNTDNQSFSFSFVCVMYLYFLNFGEEKQQKGGGKLWSFNSDISKSVSFGLGVFCHCSWAVNVPTGSGCFTLELRWSWGEGRVSVQRLHFPVLNRRGVTVFCSAVGAYQQTNPDWTFECDLICQYLTQFGEE